MQDNRSRKLELGIYDIPLEQKQDILEVDFLSSNIAAFGSKQSGKTMFIKNLLVRIHEKIDPQELSEEIYILDLNGTLGDYSMLSFVCACFDDSNEENVKTLFRTVEKRLNNNSEILRNLKCSNLSGYLSKDNIKTECENKPVHITLIIENMNAFLSEERFSLYHELLLKFCRDGISKGLSVVFTANGVTGVSRYLQNMEMIVAFNTPADQTIEIFNEKAPQIMRLPGRGIVRKESKLYEFQAFLPFEFEEQELPVFIENLDKSFEAVIPQKLIGFTKTLDKSNFQYNTYSKRTYDDFDSQTDDIIVGLDYYEHEVIKISQKEARCIGIQGKRGFGKTNLLHIIADGILKKYKNQKIETVVLFDDGREQLNKLNTYISKKYPTVRLEFMNDLKKFTEYIVSVNNTKPFVNKNKHVLNAKGNENKLNAFDPNAPLNQEDSDSLYNDFFDSNSKDSEIIAEAENTTVPSEAENMLFVIQSKLFFRKNDALRNNICDLISEADQRNMIFIFSDLKQYAEIEERERMNSLYSHVFLLDNIAEFVAERSTGSVFHDMDPKELKLEYAKCETGDGYLYDIEGDKTIKLKFMKSDF